MTATVFLCDKMWNIRNIMKPCGQLPVHSGEYLTDLVKDPDVLRNDCRDKYALLAYFPRWDRELSVTVRAISDSYLVFITNFNGNRELVEFMSLYSEGVEWAENHLEGLYHNEYYQISQLNNQLINARRELTRSNHKLKQAVIEIEETNQRLTEAERAANKAMNIAKRANQLKTEFLANMSHDIRTPMNAIVGLSNLMVHDAYNPEKILNYAEKLQTTSQHLLGLLNDVLDLSKIESGSVTLRTESVNLSEQLDQIEAVIRPQAKKRKQVLTVQTRRIRHENFFGDAVRLRQVLLNLLSNSVKYTQEEGNIHFIIEETDGENGMIFYRFIVEDNGMGMTQDYLEHIFEPFSRSEDSAVSEIQGTGLGMAITHNIVEMMGGTISVESALSRGSRFEVRIPVKPDNDAESLRERRNILIVGAETEQAEEIRYMLDGSPITAEMMDSAAEAALYSADGNIDCILLFGAPYSEQLKKDVHELRDIFGASALIFGISEYPGEDITEQVKYSGLDGFIPLPFLATKLEREVEQTQKRRGENGSENKLLGLEGIRLLCAEDNELNADILGAVLDMAGIAYKICANGRELVDEFESSGDYYDGILTDVQMPVMNGYEATRAIRSGKTKNGRTIPIIAMTANVFAEDIQKCLDAGMNAHIGKPIDVGQLEKTLAEYMTGNEKITE